MANLNIDRLGKGLIYINARVSWREVDAWRKGRFQEAVNHFLWLLCAR